MTTDVIIHDILTLKEDENMLDVTNYRLEPGDDVVYISNDSGERQPEIKRGTVQKITTKSVTVLGSGGDMCRIVGAYDLNGEESRLEKIAILGERQRRGGPRRDVTGYPVTRGDVVVFRGPVFMRTSKKLIVGRIESLTAEYAYVYEYETEKVSRRMISMLVVIEPKEN